VGRKTANVILNEWFGEPTIAVDTHIFRISRRIGLVPQTANNVDKVEQGLEKNIPPKFKRYAHHWLILHGRYICKARKPDCDNCCINQYCKKIL
jgi:endonuclease-3